MAATVVRGTPQRVASVGTTCTELQWTGGRPRQLSVTAPSGADLLVAIGDGLDGAALPTHYWTVTAGASQALDMSGTGAAICIAVSTGTATVTVWGA